MGVGMTEDELMRQFMAHRSRLHALAYAVTRDFHLAEDVLQEVALALIRHRQEAGGVRAFPAWAMAITRNKALEALRKRRRAPVPLEAEALRLLEDSLVRVASTGSIGGRRDALARCLEVLGARARDLLEMKYGHKMPVAEIARAIERSPAATNSLLQRLRGKLADCMDRRTAPQPGTGT
jgi:RNA polymerase sigma-70 factor (ECF subfamily)